MRSAVVDRATPDQRRLAETLEALQRREIESLRPGVHAREIDALVRNPALELGLRPS